jgi:2'-5' RNA ligase
MSRLFVAVWPSDAARQHIRSLPRDGWTDVRWTPLENWHVTLAFLGEADIDAVTRRLGGGDYPSATAEVGSRMALLGRSSLVLPVTGVDALAGAVRARVFDEPPGTPFRGHLTVGRSRGKRPISRKAGSMPAPAAVAFDVDEIALVRSTLSSDGARYDTVSTFACR